MKLEYEYFILLTTIVVNKFKLPVLFFRLDVF